MSAELAFEYLAAAIESVHGTPIAAPVFYTNLMGTIDQADEYYEPTEFRGTKAASYRTARVRSTATVSAEGGLDVQTLPMFMEASINGGGAVTPSEVETSVAWLWEYIPPMSSDTLDSLTLFWGDPNVQIYQSAYAMVDSWTISGDASSTDGSMFSLNLTCKAPVKLAAPALPSQVVGDLMSGLKMQGYLDTSSAIGTTLLSNKLISASHTLTTNTSYKYLAAGPTAGISFTQHGIGRPRLVTSLSLEFDDSTEMDLVGQVVKCRVRHNGPLVTGSATNYQYCEVDTYGRLRFTGWSDLEGTNRVANFEIHSEVDTTLGADYRVAIQNDMSALPT